jgi:hypothetical protein
VALRVAWPAAAALIALITFGALVRFVALSAADSSLRTPVPRGFYWLRPAAMPPSWKTARTRSGATLAFPPGWREIQADRGTVSAAPAGPRGYLVGYLNATPLSGAETLANWKRFRVVHLAEEGARGVRLEAGATGLRLRSGRGSCVIDSYSTTRARFREIACIVTGARATTVIVAAAPARTWTHVSSTLEQAVASFTT